MSIVSQGEVARESGGEAFLYPQLTMTNYMSWVIRVQTMMEDQGSQEIVKPAAGEVVDEKKDKKARSHLFQALPKDLLIHVARKKTAKRVWDCLKTTSVGGRESLDQYAGKHNSMSVRYANLRETLDDVALVKKLFDTVPDRFLSVITGIEQFYDLDNMSFEEDVGRLMAFEEYSNNHSRGGHGRGKDHGKGGRSVMSCNDEENGSGSCRRNKIHIRCFNCHKMGHYANECKALKKKEEETHLTRADDTEPALLLVVSKELA
ncbi:uncharacterized protein LOC133889508 [Phragmites australis]|uniref:uncharacterized protein LOC133889508 n=1 Tax=Phragmites australis TaxID=29695 RepID=UPI002D77442F|nr:uncharacterized protein LOC133889508 [Phragmites australis]